VPDESPGLRMETAAPSRFAIFSLWLVLQVGALTIAALRIPLSADHPRPAESIALQLLLITQICASSVFGPILFRGWPTLFTLMVVSYPFCFLAGFLSFAPVVVTVKACVYLTVWLLTIGPLQIAFRGTVHQYTVAAISVAWALLGPLLMYLKLEFGEGYGATSDLAWAGPVMGVMSLSSKAWGAAALGVLVAQLVVWGLRTRRGIVRAKLST
jgi:hypothetical protein